MRSSSMLQPEAELLAGYAADLQSRQRHAVVAGQGSLSQIVPLFGGQNRWLPTCATARALASMIVALSKPWCPRSVSWSHAPSGRGKRRLVARMIRFGSGQQIVRSIKKVPSVPCVLLTPEPVTIPW